jgi:hypothetical protein
VRERDRETETDRDRQRERQRQRETGGDESVAHRLAQRGDETDRLTIN